MTTLAEQTDRFFYKAGDLAPARGGKALAEKDSPTAGSTVPDPLDSEHEPRPSEPTT